MAIDGHETGKCAAPGVGVAGQPTRPTVSLGVHRGVVMNGGEESKSDTVGRKPHVFPLLLFSRALIPDAFRSTYGLCWTSLVIAGSPAVSSLMAAIRCIQANVRVGVKDMYDYPSQVFE